MKPSDHFPALKLAAADTFRWLRWQAQAALLGPTPLTLVTRVDFRGPCEAWLDISEPDQSYFKHGHGMEIDAAHGDSLINTCAPLVISRVDVANTAIYVMGASPDIMALEQAARNGDAEVMLYHRGATWKYESKVSR